MNYLYKTLIRCTKAIILLFILLQSQSHKYQSTMSLSLTSPHYPGLLHRKHVIADEMRRLVGFKPATIGFMRAEGMQLFGGCDAGLGEIGRCRGAKVADRGDGRGHAARLGTAGTGLKS